MVDFSSKNKSLSVNSENTEEYLGLVEKLKKHNLATQRFTIPKFRTTEKIKIESIIEEKEKIKNEALKQDINLKKKTLKFLCNLLFIETIILFLFSFFQAVKWPMEFGLEEWSFKLLIIATISQITIMLLVAVKHLFPNQQ